MKIPKLISAVTIASLATGPSVPSGRAQTEASAASLTHLTSGKRLFENETFGGNGRTCSTCHTRDTGTISPADAQRRYAKNPRDPLFLHDGSDDGKGNGATRMLSEATFLVEVPLPPNVTLADDPSARSVVLKRGVPSTLNVPALDPVLMLDGRDPNLEAQAAGAIRSHYQTTKQPAREELLRIAQFQRTAPFFSSPALLTYALGGPPPRLPQGRTESEKRGRRFFEDAPFAPGKKEGVCALCHSGPMLDETNRFAPFAPPGSRFQNVLVSELNKAGNRVRDFIFRSPDGSTTIVSSADPGRALITGRPDLGNFDNLNAFKIPTLWGVARTAPYFHDNSAKTLEELADHYQAFMKQVGAPVILTEQDKADMVAYMKLLH